MADGFVPIFRPAGTGHRAGAVPDPVDSPVKWVLRADATWGPQNPDPSSQQTQIVALTIATGAASATGSGPFSPTFGGPPVVLVSCDNPALIASCLTSSATGCVVEISAAVETIAAESGNVSVLAKYG